MELAGYQPDLSMDSHAHTTESEVETVSESVAVTGGNILNGIIDAVKFRRNHPSHDHRLNDDSEAYYRDLYISSGGNRKDFDDLFS